MENMCMYTLPVLQVYMSNARNYYRVTTTSQVLDLASQMYYFN